jgi:pyrroline-5-carboxylate reductase
MITLTEARAHRYGFVGAGNMSTALVSGIVNRSGCDPTRIWVSSPSGPKNSLQSLGVHCTNDNTLVVRNCDVLILCVKPFIVPSVMRELAEELAHHRRHLLISVAAGVSIAQLADMLGAHGAAARVARAMPNVAAQIGQGASAVCYNDLCTPDDIGIVRAIFSALGSVETVKEMHMDAVTGLSGSGPAYVAMFVEALADGAVAAGLPRATAMALAIQLVRGTAALLQETGQHPGQLKDAVASPGGTTIAGIHALEKGGMRGAVMSAVVDATRRSAELRANAAKPVGRHL